MKGKGSSTLSRSIVILTIVSVVAIAVNLVFAHSLHFEFLGLVGFGFFCFAYGMVLPSLLHRNGTSVSMGTSCSSSAQSRISTEAHRGGQIEVAEPGDTYAGYEAPCKVHALTIDLEDYFHTEVASQAVSPAQWEFQPSRIEASTYRLLRLLEHHQTHATFFVLGWVAKRYPHLIQEIHHRGHEIGCHSLDHQLVNRLTPAKFYETTARAKDLIESTLHAPIFGYRAPCFSITPGCEWAFETLVQLGFTYDSSVHPVHHPVYGNALAPRGSHAVAHGRLLEFPIATWKIAGRNLPVGGGAYLRLLPYQYIHRGLAAWENEMGTPAMLYLHPWEIDPYQPHLPLSFRSTVRQTWGTSIMEDKLQRLLTHFRFAPVCQAYRRALEGVGFTFRKSALQHAEEVAQVAG